MRLETYDINHYTPRDSTNNPIYIGDRVRFRGKEYTIKNFLLGCARIENLYAIEFEEDQHIEEIADEFSVDKIWE